MWQLLTRSEPFLELFTTKEIFEAVYEKKRRPIIPENASEHLRNLIESCWDQNPANRPEFKEGRNFNDFSVRIWILTFFF